MASLFPRFERLELEYKTLNNVPFETSVLIPKDILSVETECPLLVHFHGGGLVMGTALDPAFTSQWMLELAEEQNAIVVSPSYRLLPEATGGEILDDIAEFWEWVTSPALPDAISSRWPNLILNNTHVAVTGESAGGYLALQSAFLFQSEARQSIRVVMAQYPSMYPDVLDPYLVEHGDPFPNVPENSEEIVNEYIDNLPPGSIRLSSPFPQNSEVAFSLRTSKRRPALMSDTRLELGPSLDFAEKVPPLWILQGTDDTIIPLEVTEMTVAQIQQKHPDTQLLYTVRPGDHGLDTNHTLAEPYISEAMMFVHKYWPTG